MIKVIFFDWGQVFANVDFGKREEELNKILKPAGLTWKDFLPFWWQFYLLISSGSIKDNEQSEIFIKRVIQKNIPVKELIEFIVSEVISIPQEHINIVKELKRDYKVAILSNNVKEWINKILDNYKIENLFDAVIVSSEVGARKPNMIIYQEALDKFPVKPHETVLISDELADDLGMASVLGMKTIWVRGKTEGYWQKKDEKILAIYKPNAIIRSLSEVSSVVKNL